MKKNEVIQKIIQDLVAVTPNVPAEKIVVIVDEIMNEYTNSIEMKLTEMIRTWEDRMPEDSTLYTLGVRRALDVVKGKDPDDISVEVAK